MKKYILDRIAFFVSFLSSPYITIAGFGLLNISIYSSNSSEFQNRGGLFLLFIIFLPLLYIVAAMRAGLITDLHVMIRNQRGMPFLIALLGAIALSVLFYVQNVPREIQVMTSMIAASGLIFFIISKYWKISLHTSSLAGCIAVTAILIDVRFWWLLLTVPAVMWSRTYRRKHDVWQGIVSFLVILGITALASEFFGFL